MALFYYFSQLFGELGATPAPNVEQLLIFRRVFQKKSSFGDLLFLRIPYMMDGPKYPKMAICCYSFGDKWP